MPPHDSAPAAGRGAAAQSLAGDAPQHNCSLAELNGATLACNAPTHVVTKVTTSSAERVRRHRARKKIEAQLQLDELTFVRPDWACSSTLIGSPRKPAAGRIRCARWH